MSINISNSYQFLASNTTVSAGNHTLLKALKLAIGDSSSIEEQLHMASKNGEEFMVHAIRYAYPHLFVNAQSLIHEALEAFPALAEMLEQYVLKNAKPPFSLEMVYLYLLLDSSELNTIEIAKIFQFLKNENRLDEVDLNIAASVGINKGKSIFYLLCRILSSENLQLFIKKNTRRSPDHIHTYPTNVIRNYKVDLFVSFCVLVMVLFALCASNTLSKISSTCSPQRGTTIICT